LLWNSTGSVTAGTVTGAVGTLNYSWKMQMILVVELRLLSLVFLLNLYGKMLLITVLLNSNPVTIGQPNLLIASSIYKTIICEGGTTTVVVSATGGTGTLSIGTEFKPTVSLNPILIQN
jgi:hypothetical protein